MVSNPCTECGGPLAPGSKFCPACGAPIVSAPATPTVAEETAAALPSQAKAGPSQTNPPSLIPSRNLTGFRLAFAWFKLILLMLGAVAVFLCIIATIQAVGKWLPKLLR